MKSCVLKIILLVATLVGFMVLMLTSCGPTVGYWRFLVRSQAYYGQVAGACDTLLAEHVADMPCKMVGRKLELLPGVLVKLRPSFVTVDTNAVSLLVGGGFDSYQVVWASSDTNGLWVLKVYREGSPVRMFFSKSKPSYGHGTTRDLLKLTPHGGNMSGIVTTAREPSKRKLSLPMAITGPCQPSVCHAYILEPVWKVVKGLTLTLSYFCEQFRTSCGCVTQLI